MGTMADAGTRTLLLLIALAALAGCESARLTFEKPGVAAADLKRDQNECVSSALISESKSLLTPNVDRDVLIRCMQARGYTAVMK